MTAATVARRAGAVAALIVAAGGAAPAPAQGPEAALAAGWREYGLQSFRQAQRHFEAAAADPAATTDQRWQAQMGAAMVVHYQMPGRDPQAARPLYEALLAATHDAGRRAMVRARLGDSYAEERPPALEAARRHYHEALRLAAPGSLVAQETALRLVTTYMRRPDAAEFAAGLALAAALAEALAGTALEGALHGLRAELAAFLGDEAAMAEALMAQDAAGINNRQVRERVLFQLARLHEVAFDDPVRAGHYYGRLAREVPTSQKAHFARLRAAELAAGPPAGGTAR